MISASSSRRCTRSILPFDFAIDEFVHVQEPADGRILRFLRDEMVSQVERAHDRLLPGQRNSLHEAMTRLWLSDRRRPAWPLGQVVEVDRLAVTVDPGRDDPEPVEDLARGAVLRAQGDLSVWPSKVSVIRPRPPAAAGRYASDQRWGAPSGRIRGRSGPSA